MTGQCANCFETGLARRCQSGVKYLVAIAAVVMTGNTSAIAQTAPPSVETASTSVTGQLQRSRKAEEAQSETAGSYVEAGAGLILLGALLTMYGSFGGSTPCAEATHGQRPKYHPSV